MSKNLCPFNKFEKCIGKDCVLFLDDVTAITESEGRIFETDFNKLLEIPCAIVLSGLSSVYKIATENTKTRLKNG